MSEQQGATAGQAQPEAGTVDRLEERLGLRFGDRERALAAVTHKSYVNEHRDQAGAADNERLEFLGDAVIDLAVSHRLMERFPGAREGDLSKMRAAVVDEPGLCGMARALDLGSLLRLGRGEELTGGRQKASLLADAMEAVIAAVFLEAGLEPVLHIVDRFLGEAFARATAGTLDRDFKTQLQELAQSRLRAAPRYRVVAERGPDHSKTFEMELDLRGEVLGRGLGRSKKDAEQAAAKSALEILASRMGNEGVPGEGQRLAAEAAPEDPAAPAEPPAAPVAEAPLPQEALAVEQVAPPPGEAPAAPRRPKARAKRAAAPPAPRARKRRASPPRLKAARARKPRTTRHPRPARPAAKAGARGKR